MVRRSAFVLLAMFFLLYGDSAAQTCTNRFASFFYKSNSFDTFRVAIATATNDFVVAGSVLRDHAFAARFSSRGTLLFAYQYNPVYQADRIYYQNLKLTDIIETQDGGFVAVGSVIQDKWIGLNEYINRVGVLVKTDRFGNVAWSRKFESHNGFTNSGYELSMTNVVETSTGDLVTYLASQYGRHYPAYGRLVCFSRLGVEKWNTLLGTAEWDGGISSLDAKRGLVECADGTVAVADLLYKTDRTGAAMITRDAQLHLFGVEPRTGKISWESGYKYPLSVPVQYADVTGISELSSKHLLVTTSSLNLPAGEGAPAIETNSRGKWIAGHVYRSSSGNTTKLLKTVTLTNESAPTYFFQEGQQGVLAKVAPGGAFLWQRGFNAGGGGFPANTIARSATGYAVFMSSYRSHDARVLFTDTTAFIACASTETGLVAESFTMEEGSFKTEPGIPDQNRFGVANFPVRAVPYPLDKRTECEDQLTCCHDVVDSTSVPPLDLCEGSSYTLPDNTVVGGAGRYYVKYRLPGGCDSLQFYEIRVKKSPVALSLGQDTCIAAGSSVTLRASEGYDRYAWMSNPPSDSNTLSIRGPGTYVVRVSNICGSHSDTINVYAACDFPVMVPTAFTPNGDGNNDVFRLPPNSPHQLLSLTIYNRWGNRIFSTRTGRWDGTVNKQPQPSGVFVYYMQIRGLSGNVKSKKGTVLLLR